MKEVFRASSLAQVSLYQTLLENAGVRCFVRNETTQQSIVGGLAVAFFPLPDFWPTLCLLDDGDYPQAMELLREIKDAAPSTESDWTCAACEEKVPGNFTACWKCQTERHAKSL